MDERVAELERLYAEQYVGFRNAAATITGDYDSARDAVQEGFARAIAHRETFRESGSLRAWVWQIIFRAALDGRRARNRQLINGKVMPELVEPGRDPDLAAALATLSPRRRLVVFLRYFADFSHAEIAEACGISEGTVSATLAQARAALAETLTSKGVAQ